MKSSLPRRQIVELFDELDGHLTVVSFNNGNRIMTYGNLNVFQALAEVAHRQASGNQTLVLLKTEENKRRYATNLGLWDRAEDVPQDLIWNPNYTERGKFRKCSR